LDNQNKKLIKTSFTKILKSLSFAVEEEIMETSQLD
jgi:hypothetical protein